jgi:uncharacterized protein involved in exopolysaccharide biosynthesis
MAAQPTLAVDRSGPALDGVEATHVSERSRVIRAVAASWRKLALAMFLAGILAAGATLVIPNTYTASTTFMPETKSSSALPSSVAGLASQLGVTVSADPTDSPQFYADLVRSRTLMERLLVDTFPGHPGGRRLYGARGRVLDILEVRGPTPANRLVNARMRLADATRVAVDRRTGVLTLSFVSVDPVFAAWAANRLVNYLGDFNRQTRQSQARAQRVFAEERATVANTKLLEAEGALRAFYDENKSWQTSPRLVFEEGRLRRRVEIQSELLETLLRQAEMTRLSEVNDLPVFTVIDQAEVPVLKTGPLRRVIVMVAVGLTFVVGVALALIPAYEDRLRAQLPELFEGVAALRGRFQRKSRYSATRSA